MNDVRLKEELKKCWRLTDRKLSYDVSAARAMIIYKNMKPTAMEWCVLISAGLLSMVTYYSLFYPIVGSETANKILGVIGLLSLFLLFIMFAGRSQMKT